MGKVGYGTAAVLPEQRDQPVVVLVHSLVQIVIYAAHYDKPDWINCQIGLFRSPDFIARFDKDQEHDMDQQTLIVIGTPVQEGTGRPGCNMGPDAFRAAGLIPALAELGHQVEDRGNLVPSSGEGAHHANPVLKFLPEFVGWTHAIRDAVIAARADGIPVVVGGDHSLAAGSLTGNAAYAGERGRPFFVLWLDAHPDFHTLETTTSGNLHGVPMAYACGLGGFEGALEKPAYPIDPKNICMMGIRSVDPAERVALAAHGVTVCDMRMIDEEGIVPLLKRFLDKVKAAAATCM